MPETEILEKWQVSTRLLSDPNIPIIVLEYLGKGSARNFRADANGLSETYKAGGRWKYIAVQPHHAPTLMSPKEQGKPALFALAPNVIASKIIAYNNARAEKQLENKAPTNERKQMMVLDGMISELKAVTDNAKNSDITKSKAKRKNKEEELEQEEVTE